jgi:hypothetical protein
MVPLLLVASVALGGAPEPHAALVYTVLFTCFGAFGAAVPWARDAERGFIERVRLTGTGGVALALERIAAGALIDLIELLPSLAVIALVHGSALVDALRMLGWVAGGLLAANALGVIVAGLARSIAETALLAAVASLLLLHAAGVFREPAPGGPAAALQRAVPFHYMHAAIQRAAGAR